MHNRLSIRAAIAGFALGIAAGLAGCASASPPPITPQSTVYAAKAAYATALKGAVAYRNLPACAQPPVMPCRDEVTLEKVRKADVAAAATLDAAELAARSGGSTGVRDDLITAARSAVAAFTELIRHLPTKEQR